MKSVFICKTKFPQIMVPGIGKFKNGDRYPTSDPRKRSALLSTGEFIEEAQKEPPPPPDKKSEGRKEK